MTVYPLETARVLALHVQGLHTANTAVSISDRDAVYRTVDQIGCVQIDTLQMVARAHHLTIWSRLGNYNTTDFDALAFDPSDRRLFEGRQHAASYIPTHEYRYQMPRQRALREQPNDWYTRWLTQLGHPETIAYARERVKKDGALKVSDFERGDHPAGTWWNWRPAKVALEYLFAYGDLMISNRVNFQRVYDLTGRVLPTRIDINEPTVEECDQFWIERGVKALGICSPQQAGDYSWMKVNRSRPIVKALTEQGSLIPVHIKLANGDIGEYLVHRENMPLLQQVADGGIKSERTTFLNPFDNFFWARSRDRDLWGYEKSFEAYVPAHKRKYGYYCMNILHKDRLVGRFDPKLERKTGTLRLKALYLEPGTRPNSEMVHAIALSMRDFMNFHKAKDLVIEQSRPVNFAKKLLDALA